MESAPCTLGDASLFRCEQDEESEENPKELTGLPQRFCEAKDLWEEEKQASKPCPDKGGAGKVCLASTSK